MKLHRFYIADKFELGANLWVDDKELFHQWTRVLRFEPGREIILFNNIKEERLYRIEKIGNNAVNLNLVTEIAPILPSKDIYICFSLLKKDKNDWVLQKATELGARHLIPLITDRTEKTGFDIDRAKKIVIEASEQCGRTDVPNVREPIRVETIIDELILKTRLFVAEQSSKKTDKLFQHQQGYVNPQKHQATSDAVEGFYEADKNEDRESKLAVLVGPEGGWSDSEKNLFKEKNIEHLSLSEFTLRAETACVTSVILLQLL